MLKEDNVKRPTVPHNKVIVAFRKDEIQYRDLFLKRVFNQPSLIHNDTNKRIAKNLLWKTKYYDLKYDLYIDEYDNLEEWLSELKTYECAELRDVLGGIIIVDKFNSKNTNYMELLKGLNGPEFNNCFKVFCDMQENIDQAEIDKMNDEFTIQQLDLEVVNWHFDDEINEYGEKIGISRLKENIDTHEWNQCESVMKVRRIDDTFGDNDIEGNEKETEPDIEAIMRRLQEARLRFAKQELNDTDAFEMADDVADEIMKYM